MFLDSLTGDLFSYNKDKQEWKPYGNTGLHWARGLQVLQGGAGLATADMMTGTDGDSLAKATDGLKEIISKTSCQDITCNMRKAFVSHWILKDVK
jgi:hypothetical protein